MKSKSIGKQVPRGCSWTVLVVGLILLVLGVLSAAAFPFVLKRSREIWPEASGGKITEAYVETGERKGSKSGKRRNRRSTTTTFMVMLKYSYLVEGVAYHGDLRAPNQPESDEVYKQAQAVMETYKAGDDIKVYHKPADPANSRFTAKEAEVEFWLDMGFTAFYLICGALFIFVARKALALNPRPPPVASAS